MIMMVIFVKVMVGGESVALEPCKSQPCSQTGKPHLPNGPVHPYQLDKSIFHLRGVWCSFFIFIIFVIEIPVSKQCRH